ncbi:phage minor head protein [Rhizobium sp. FKY42]|uniref:phage head morphogenesis protein n=1 Tax=Rhizobium sp. FKY42 TaxID=2562310 RepID=UPI0010BF72FB|nr:phage minor head protein [Rhizobium sp. FKY42]
MAEIRKGFAPPVEVTGFFDRKTATPAFSWADVWAEEHAYRFTVAKAVELDVLNAFRGTIAQAIAEGKGFDNWKPLIEKELTKLGWWQPRMVADPSGIQPERMVNFSSDRRLKTIFWSNMNSARAAGQWERAQRSKKTLPYVLYLRTTSGDPRPEHLLWVGTILPIDHPFWNTHWPPNGWLCKCQVRMISAREAERLLGTERVYGKDADGNEIRVRYTDQVPDLGPDLEYRNRRTGEVSMVPPGIDPGWQTNPGLARASTLIQNLETKLAVADPGDAVRVLKDLWADPYLKIAPKLPEKVWLPAAHSAPLAAELGAVSPVVSITSETIKERMEKHKMPIDDFALLPEILTEGQIYSDPRGDSSVRAVLMQIGKTWWRSFVTKSINGYLRATSLHQIRDVQAQKMTNEN